MNADGKLILTVQYPGASTEVPLGYAQDSIICFVRSKPLDAGDPRMTKFISEVLTEITNRTDSLRLLIYGMDKVGDEPKLLASLPLAEEDQVKRRVMGKKYYVIEFRDEVVSALWTISRLFLIGSMGGGRR